MTENDQIAQFVSEGRSYAQAAEEFGRSYTATRILCNRRGVYSQSGLAPDWRHIAEGMKPSDAVDYLWGIVEALTEQAEPVKIDGWAANLTALEQRVVQALLDNKGHAMSKEHLLQCIYFDRPGDLPDIKIVDVLVCKIRAKKPKGLKIITHWGRGYEAVEVSK